MSILTARANSAGEPVHRTDILPCSHVHTCKRAGALCEIQIHPFARHCVPGSTAGVIRHAGFSTSDGHCGNFPWRYAGPLSGLSSDRGNRHRVADTHFVRQRSLEYPLLPEPPAVVLPEHRKRRDRSEKLRARMGLADPSPRSRRFDYHCRYHCLPVHSGIG